MGIPLPDSGSVTEDVGVVGGFLVETGDIDFGPFFNDDEGLWTAETITGSYDSQLVINDDGEWTYTADNSNTEIQALNAGETLTEVFTVTSTRGSSSVTITINGSDEPPCFVAGTLIDTPNGPRPVEQLRPGDRVLTCNNGEQVIRWAGERRITLAGVPDAEKLRPIRMKKDSLAPGVPDRDILFSPMHRVLLGGSEVELLTGEREVLCPIGHLVNGQTILREQRPEVSYHHLLFDEHQLLRSSGCASESFLPGPVGLGGFLDETREEVFGLFPELRSLPESYGQAARYIAKRHETDLIRESLRPAGGFFNLLRRKAA